MLARPITLPPFRIWAAEHGEWWEQATEPYEKEAVEEEGEGMNGGGKKRAEGQTDAPRTPELPWTMSGLHFPSSSASFYRTIFAQRAG